MAPTVRILLAVLLCVSGCGRVGFDPSAFDPSASDASMGDASMGDASMGDAGPPQPSPCVPGATSSWRLAYFWSFNEPGPSVLDFGPHRLQGVPGGSAGPTPGPIRIPGVIGLGLRFDGVDDRVTVFAPDDGRIELGDGELSADLWVRLRTPCAASTSILAPMGVSRGWRLGCEGTSIEFTVHDASGDTLVSTPSLAPGWHHVVAIRRVDGLVLFVDGDLAADTPGPTGALDAPLALLMGHDGARAAAVDLDEVRLWRCALSDAEAAGLWHGLPAGMLAYWTFDDGTASGWAGLGHAGRVVGPGVTFTPHGSGLAATFDGSGGRIEMDLPGWFDREHTISVWWRADSTGGGQSIVNREVRPRSPVHLWLDDSLLNTNVRDSMSVGSGATVMRSLTDSTWHHTAVVRRGGDSGRVDVSLYLDGELAGMGSADLALTSAPAAPFTIGYRLPDDVRPFHGAIDDLRVYGRALSGDEVRWLYAIGR